MLIKSRSVIQQTPKKKGDYKNVYRYVWRVGICQRACVGVCFKEELSGPDQLQIKTRYSQNQGAWASVLAAVGDWPHVPDAPVG